MPALVTVEIPQLRDLRGRFASMDDARLAAMRRDSMREAGEALIQKLSFEAPRRSGDLAKNFYYRTFESASGLVLKVYNRMFYAGIVATGTTKKDYPIPKSGKPMLFGMDKSEIVGAFAARQAKVVFRYTTIIHPGQVANPYHKRAIDGLRPEWDRIWNRMGVRVVQQLAGH